MFERVSADTVWMGWFHVVWEKTGHREYFKLESLPAARISLIYY